MRSDYLYGALCVTTNEMLLFANMHDDGYRNLLIFCAKKRCAELII